MCIDEHAARGRAPVSRRAFLGTGLRLGAASLAAPAMAVGAAQRPGTVEAFELDEITVGELQEGMKSGKFTARAVAEKYLQRIEQVDRAGPTVRSVIETNPDALSIADTLDAERKAQGPRGPLHGIPVLIKDNIATGDRMMTTAGSLALAGSRSPKDSGVARRLRQAGAVILGKANLSEWANYRSTHSSSGWSGRGGQTNNPYALDRNPCGSSSGSGAAAAANLCALTVGTETDGSVVCPSSINGIVGIKPTVGLLSRAGIIPISHTQDTPGPMCRTVTDAAILLGALAGIDAADPATAASRGKGPADYAKYLDRNGLRGARIGVVRKYFDAVEAHTGVMEAALDLLKRQGALLIDPADIATIGKWDDSEGIVLSYEFKHNLNACLAEYAPNAQAHTLKDLIEFNDQNREREMPYFGQEQFLHAEERGPLTDKTYRDALALDNRLTRREGIDAVMDKNKLDALVAPTAGPAWLTDWVDGDHDTSGSSSAAAVAGYPSISVPAGYVFGLPVGISFFGRAWSEPKLIAIAYAFEQASKVRKPPQFLSSADLRPASS